MSTAGAPPQDSLPVCLLIPVFNDWISVAQLVPELDQVLGDAGLRASIVLVDDGSTDDEFAAFKKPATRFVDEIRVVRLRRNLGHQRAIAIGLSYIQARLPADLVVVMDGDGEDAPQDVPRLVERARDETGRKVVFARRERRAEGLTFRIFYQLYRLLHRLLVGRGIRFGNFSAIPAAALVRLVSASELWNHYAAAVVKARLPYVEVATQRRRRLNGSSKMTFVSLVTHGLSAISVFHDVVGTRLLVAACASGGLLLACMGAVIGVRLATDLAIPGWATYSLAFLTILLVQTTLAAFLFTFITLASRSQVGSLPCRDWELHVMAVTIPPGP